MTDQDPAAPGALDGETLALAIVAASDMGGWEIRRANTGAWVNRQSIAIPIANEYARIAKLRYGAPSPDPSPMPSRLFR